MNPELFDEHNRLVDDSGQVRGTDCGVRGGVSEGGLYEAGGESVHVVPGAADSWGCTDLDRLERLFEVVDR